VDLRYRVRVGMVVRDENHEKLGSVKERLAREFIIEKGATVTEAFAARYENILDLHDREIVYRRGSTKR